MAEEAAKQKQGFFIGFFANLGLYRLSLFLVLYIIVLLALTLPVFSNRVTLQEGEVTEWDILSPITGEIETKADRAQTEVMRGKREQAVETVYIIDKSIVDRSKADVTSYFGKIRKLKEKELADEERAALGQSLEFNLSSRSLGVLSRANNTTLKLLESIILRTSQEILLQGVEDAKSAQIQQQIDSSLKDLLVGKEYKRAVREVIIASLYPNKVVNQRETDKRRRLGKNTIIPMHTKLRRGSPIVFSGEKITKEHIAIFTALGIYGRGVDWSYLFSAAGMELILFFFFFMYLFFYRRKVYDDPKRLLVLAILISVTVLLGRFLSPWNGHFVPVPAAAMLLVILVDGPVAIISTVLMSFFIGMIFNFDFSIISMLLFGSFVAISRSTGIFQRTDLTKAGFLIGLTNMAVVLLVAILKKVLIWPDILPDLVFGGVNGVVSAIFVIGTLPYWETTFNIITPMRLGEFANPNQPLLKRLLVEAPGTYHHSLVVANMAEAAAEVIGANSLLARVGGYYHDVGKIKRPYFFVENQIGAENPHDKIQPRLSALIILSHPRDGVELAVKYKLPSMIIDIIAQHHGTSMVSFFYRQFLAKAGEEKINENEFRYEGPTPKSKEAAVVMMADSVEAAVRSLERPTPHKIEALIRKIFKERLDDGQLDDCRLTLKDLDKMREAFLYVLGGRLHSRVEYPDKEIEEEEELKTENAKFDMIGD
ncbi:HD family phosphohydrolase [Candidatus Margulisiibacteriota bacterium]